MRPYDLLLLHGQPGLGRDWQQVQAALPAEFRVVAPDRPGYGSSLQAGGGFEVGAAAVIADLDRRDIDRAVLVGHSYGGGVALTTAALSPERVEALVLLATVGPQCLTGWDTLLAAPWAGPVCAFCAWSLTPWFARARLKLLARRVGSTQALQQHVNWAVWAHARWEHGAVWRTFLAEQRALVHEADGLARLATSVHVPVLIVADPADTLVPFKTAQALERLLPDARLELARNAGHHLPLRSPDQVARKITTFLESLPVRSEAAQASDTGSDRP